jgi:hypothetical protein
MGAALTYARRYALFTLVGIAGEDDLDAPDLLTPTSQTSAPQKFAVNGTGDSQLNSGPHAPSQRGPGLRNGKAPLRFPSKAMLGAQASAQLRDRLIAEVNDIKSGDDAALWAHRRMSDKNTLTASDARCVENSFQALLASFAALAATGSTAETRSEEAPATATQGSTRPHAASRLRVVDKSTLAMAEPRRVRDREHVRYVARQSCLVCGRSPCDAHHLRFSQSRALDRKVSDEFTVPLCRGHHRELHRHGDEVAWWRKAALDPVATARALWLETNPQLAMPRKSVSSFVNGKSEKAAKRAQPARHRSKIPNAAN